MLSEKKDNLNWANPLIRDWFIAKFGGATEPQAQGWPYILAGKATLISAPTGSGKTFAAFLTCVERLVSKSLAGKLFDEIEVLYVSPLKALSHDIQKNLTEPLAEIMQLAEQRNLTLKEIRVAVRTGDTLPRERQAMLKKPPHILITTPESLYILLTAKKSRAMLQHVKTIIIDEIHAMANDKRGTHLSLSLERLEAVTLSSPLRIGLSATQKPIEKVARFLAGNNRPLPAIVNIGHARYLDVAVEVPQIELGSVASNEMWDEIYDKIAELANVHRTTLVFVNTRRLAERVAHHLAERLGEDQVTAHHGSLSRKLRLAAEKKLKNGDLKMLVATASLELGIDIGTVDLVCQIGSPRSIAIALQRIGRAGHWYGAVSKGRIFATTRDELVECAALVKAIREGDLDQLIMPEQPLDVLSQQIVATSATSDWDEANFFQFIKRAFPYHNLSQENFNSVLQMLSDGVAGTRGRYGAYLFRDQINNQVKARRNARFTAITNGGVIPENGLFAVIAEPQGVMVGTLDEDFAIESNRNDVILLGTTSWKIKRIESAAGRVLVEDAHGAPPSVPFWRGEAPSRTNELSLHVSDLRQKLSKMRSENAIKFLKENCGLDNSAAEQVVEYCNQGKKVLGHVPTQLYVIAERFFDEGGGMQLIIHAPFGARINKAWGLALRKRFCRSFNFELQAAATDDGLNISLAEQHSFPLADVFQFLHSNTIKDVLVQAVLQSPLFTTRWRWVATRALALTRFRYGKKTPPNIQRMLADDLLAAVFPDAAACQDNLAGKEIDLPDHPLINETMKEALTDALDIEGLIDVLKGIEEGNIKCIAVDTPVPSVFSHEILNANPYAFLDDAPLEERRARAVEMRRSLPESVLKEVGKLDPAAIVEIQQQAWPDVRNADELHDALQTLIALPNNSNWEHYFKELEIGRRVITAKLNNKKFWLAVEKLKTFMTIYPNAVLPNDMVEIENQPIDRESAILTMLRGWMQHMGPVTNSELSEKLELDKKEIEQAFLKLEASGHILRGNYRTTEQIEWCERRLLARIHRLTLTTLRKEIKPVTAAQFIHWLSHWQHLSPGTQLSGEQGLLEIIKQLQGFEIPANAWESLILSKRMTGYDRDMLDRLCLSGVIGWGRLSPRSMFNEEIKIKKRIQPSSVIPITFFVREESDWKPQHHNYSEEEILKTLSHIGKKIYVYLAQKGASFFADIVRNVSPLKSEIETGLWELVAAGLVTADGFDNLRALIDRKRRLDKKHRRASACFSTGRWSLLHTSEVIESTRRIESACWMLLKRYGVVFRDLLVREKNIPRWRDLLLCLRRLEDRGEIRGGRFVDGFLGEQFALPYAVESLRALRKKEGQEELIRMSAADPLNLIGIILPGERLPAVSSEKIILKNGILSEIHYCKLSHDRSR
jgi:ATP-dependent Lhr-like helicase